MVQDESEEQRPTTRSAQTPAPLHGKALVAWRVVWSLFVLFDLGILVFSIPGFIAQQRTVCTDLTRVNCGLYQLGPAQMVVLNRFGFSLVGYAAYVLMLDAVITLALLLIGALIFWHKSNDRMGLFVSLLLITFACLGVDEVHMNVINDAVLPLPLLIFGYLVLFLQWPALGFFFYLFPDGRFVPRWSWLLGFLFPTRCATRYQQASNKNLFRGPGKRRETGYIDVYRYKEMAKEYIIGEREKPAAWISSYAAGRRPKPKEWAKVAGRPWMVMLRAGKVEGRALRVKRSVQERRQ